MKNFFERLKHYWNQRELYPTQNSVILPKANEDLPGNWHVAFIEHLAAIARPGNYVEFGLYECELFNRITPYANRLIGVDMNVHSGQYMKKSSKAEFWNMTTQEFAHKLKQNPFTIDMIFIDADHSCDSVWNDFWNILPYISPHGLILLHDAHPGEANLIDAGYCGDGYLTIDNLSRQRDEFEMMTLPFSPGLAICRKRKMQLSWQEE